MSSFSQLTSDNSASSVENVHSLIQQKPADWIFDISAAAVAILISFGIGCVTDTESLKRQLKYPVSLIIGFCCQFVVIPVFVVQGAGECARRLECESDPDMRHHLKVVLQMVSGITSFNEWFQQVAFGLAMLLPMERDIRFGLLCVACVPGGGLGHIAVVIGKADISLSLTMNMISVVAMLGTAPLWIYLLGQTMRKAEDNKFIPIYNFEIWLASVFFAYTAGLVTNHFKPVIADGLLTWLIKPFLLLATILYVTLGIYINMYVFEKVDNFVVLGACLLPIIGAAAGYLIATLFRQKQSFCRAISLETSSFNCLIVTTALRFSLPNKDAAAASTFSMWVMFTIPGFYLMIAILRVFFNCISNFMETQKQMKDNQKYSLAQGLVNQSNMAAISAPLFISDSDDIEGYEKVTVL